MHGYPSLAVLDGNAPLPTNTKLNAKLCYCSSSSCRVILKNYSTKLGNKLYVMANRENDTFLVGVSDGCD